MTRKWVFELQSYLENAKRNIKEILKADKKSKLEIIKKHSKNIELKKDIIFASVERQNKFLLK